MALEMSEAEFAGMMAGGTATVASGAIVIDTSGVTAARQVMEQEAQQIGEAMIGAGESTGEGVAEIGAQVGKAIPTVKALRLETMAMRTAGMMLGRLGLPGGAELRTLSTFTRMGAVFNQLTPLVDKFATSLEAMPNMFGSLATAGAAAGGPLLAVGAALAPIAIAVGAAAVVIKLHNDALEEEKKAADKAITGIEAYYAAIEKGTTESLELAITNAKQHIDNQKEELATLQANQKKALDDAKNQIALPFTAGVSQFGDPAVKEYTDKITALNKEITDGEAKVEAMKKALGSVDVAANDVKEQTKILIGVYKDEADLKAKMADEDKNFTVKQTQDRIDAIEAEKTRIHNQLEGLKKLDQNNEDVIKSEDALYSSQEKLQQEEDHLTGPTLALAAAHDKAIAAEEKAKKDLDAKEKEIEDQNQKLASAYESYQNDVTQIEENALKQQLSIQTQYNDSIVAAAQKATDDAKKALSELEKSQASDLLNFNQENAKSAREGEDRRQEIIIKAQREEVTSYQEHLDRLKQIRDSDKVQTEQDLLDRNFLAAYKRRLSQTQQMDQENTQFAQKQVQKQQQLQHELDDEKRSEQIARRERFIAYQQRLADDKAKYQEELKLIAEEKVKELDIAVQTRNKNLQNLVTTTNQELSARRTKAIQEINMAQQTADARVKLLMHERDLALQMAGAGGTMPSGTFTTVNTAGGGGGAGLGPRRITRAMAAGGVMPPQSLAFVQEGFRGQQETYNGIPFPPGKGMFYSMEGGTVTPTKSQVGGLSLTIQINGAGISDPNILANMMEERATDVIERIMGRPR
jgi:hypothetical protein